MTARERLRDIAADVEDLSGSGRDAAASLRELASRIDAEEARALQKARRGHHGGEDAGTIASSFFSRDGVNTVRDLLIDGACAHPSMLDPVPSAVVPCDVDSDREVMGEIELALLARLDAPLAAPPKPGAL